MLSESIELVKKRQSVIAYSRLDFLIDFIFFIMENLELKLI